MLNNSVTFGIVSSTSRLGSELGMSQNRTEFIQTDAAINVGNSGGPLVNVDGEVIGINAMKVQYTSGISFAIPIDTALIVIEQLKKYKHVVRPYIGMRVGNFTAYEYKQGWLKSKQHYSYKQHVVMVTEVEMNSPAHIAGLEKGDVIVELDGKPVVDVRDILEVMGYKVGQAFQIKIMKSDGKFVSTTITSVPGRQ